MFDQLCRDLRNESTAELLPGGLLKILSAVSIPDSIPGLLLLLEFSGLIISQ